MGNPLLELQRLGQSPWLDNIHRGLLTSGTLARLVRDGDVTGLTSNPTIFEQAISGESDYDEALAKQVAAGRNPEGVVDALVVEDIQQAADAFLPVFTRTKRADGYVSIEVSPTLARDTAATIREVRRLWRAVNRPNLMVKIPGTQEGLPAVEEAIAGGINVNVTLIFALTRYDAVMESYLRGLTRRLEAGMRVDRIASVASFFVSRVDTLVDKLLDERMATASTEQRAQLERLKGKAAISQAKLAYAAFRAKFSEERFGLLAREGARPQRPLWASTSTKNPAYPDVYYVEALIGSDTVNTMPPQTLDAYKDHGHPENRIEQQLDRARAVLSQLGQAGIDMEAVTAQLEREGVASFEKSYRKLVDTVARRREAVRVGARTLPQLGPADRAVRSAVAALTQAKVGERLWKKDPTLWRPDDAKAQAEIAMRLGWLDAVETMSGRVDELVAFATRLRDAGFTHALLCGMGGSSLAPEVLRRSIGVARGWLDFAVLDSTDPAAVEAAARRSPPEKTLYIMSSKSGGTTEVDAFFRFFWQKATEALGDQAGSHFAAITDPGTPLEKLARERHFRQVFLNMPDVGGRYSALTYVGLVPAAVMGIDLPKLLGRARAMLTACAAVVPPAHNPGLWLGAVMGALARTGRDKLTLLLPERLQSFGDWTEQLIAESSGKDERGIVPVTGEPLGPPAVYGKDRLFVHLRLGAKPERGVAALARAGHPVVTIKLIDGYDLAGEFVRWEVATAVACHLIGVNAFDQPDVQSAKDETRRLLAEREQTGTLPAAPNTIVPAAPDFATRLGSHLAGARGRRYVALTAFVAPTPRRERLLRDLRTAVRKRFGVATTVGFGPRFLHSTGQLHKGGPATVIMVQLTCDDPVDFPIPGESFTFGTLKAAQALGDLNALVARRRPVLRVHLGRHVEAGLTAMLAALLRRPARPTARGARSGTRRKAVVGRARASGRR